MKEKQLFVGMVEDRAYIMSFRETQLGDFEMEFYWEDLCTSNGSKHFSREALSSYDKALVLKRYSENTFLKFVSENNWPDISFKLFDAGTQKAFEHLLNTWGYFFNYSRFQGKSNEIRVFTRRVKE